METPRIKFVNGIAKVALKNGKTAYIYRVNKGLYTKMLFTLKVDEEAILTGVTIEKIEQYLRRQNKASKPGGAV